MEKKLSVQKLLSAFLVALWIVAICIVITLCGVSVYWPAFTVLNLLTIIGFTKSNIIKILASSVSGIVFAFIYALSGYLLTAALGQTAAYLLMLFVIIFVLLAFDQVFPMFINVHAFIVFTYCTVNLQSFYTNWLSTLICAVAGGGVALAGVLLIFKVVTKHAGKNAEEASV